MEDCEDDFVVVIVNDEKTDIDNPNSPIVKNEPIKEEVEEPWTVEEFMKVAEEHGEHVNLISIKEESVSEDEYNKGFESAEDPEDYGDDADYVPEQLDLEYTPDHDISGSDDEDKSWCRLKMRRQWQRKSLVRDLIKGNPKFKNDQEALIDALVEIMRNIEPPLLPDNCYFENGENFECSKCGALSKTSPGAARHYREKHGQRYLQCFACGVNFRSTTILYKHEKRCIAPDAVVVLKARAKVLGAKARNRPFLQYNTNSGKKQPKNSLRKKQSKYIPKQFFCDRCSAMFSSKPILMSHLNHHEGIRPYRCKYCPHAYTSFRTLKRHERKHFSTVQYICDHCKRSFRVREALIAHMDTHLPLRKHACNECDRRYAQRAGLLLHINRVHRNLPPPCACQICPKRFGRMSVLKIHMQKAHGMLLMTRKMFFKTVPKMPDYVVENAKVVFKSEEAQLSLQGDNNTIK